MSDGDGMSAPMKLHVVRQIAAGVFEAGNGRLEKELRVRDRLLEETAGCRRQSEAHAYVRQVSTHVPSITSCTNQLRHRFLIRPSADVVGARPNPSGGVSQLGTNRLRGQSTASGSASVSAASCPARLIASATMASGCCSLATARRSGYWSAPRSIMSRFRSHRAWAIPARLGRSGNKVVRRSNSISGAERNDSWAAPVASTARRKRAPVTQHTSVAAAPPDVASAGGRDSDDR